MLDFGSRGGSGSVLCQALLLAAVCLCAAACPISSVPDVMAQDTTSLETGLATDPRDWTVLFAEGFEGEFPGSDWTLDGEPTWGRTSYKSHSGVWSAYGAGGGSGAVAPPGPYPNDVDTWMIYGPFDLSQATAAQFEFYYWTELAPTEDRLFWGVARNRILMLFWGDDEEETSDGWQHAVYDIGQQHPSYLGEPEVWLGFKFESDEADAAEGVYVDDILLRAQLQPEMPERICLPLLVKQCSP